MISIILPTLNRPDKLREVLVQLRNSTNKAICETLVIVDTEDRKSIEVCAEIGTDKLAENFNIRCIAMEGSPSAVEKWNEGARRSSYKHLDRAWLMLAADDIIFPENWLGLAGFNIPGAQFLAFRDRLDSSKFFEPHFAATVGWLKKYNGGVFIPPMYKQWGLDVELADKARKSLTWIVSPVVLEHRHILFKTAKNDSTYDKGKLSYSTDIELFNKRRAANYPNDYTPYLI